MITGAKAAILDAPRLSHSLPERGAAELIDRIDFLRLDACRRLEQGQRSTFGQFLTPAPVARFMASMFTAADPVVAILDAGAGIGSLFAATVAHLCDRDVPPREIRVTAYEIEPVLLAYLSDTVELCRLVCDRAGVTFTADIKAVDFLKDAAGMLNGGLFAEPLEPFTAAILNPPYRKINVNSDSRHHLRTIGIETSNLYTGFLAAAVRLLSPGGELVAITPRSFCNGTYFRAFRSVFLREMALRRIHLFDSRQEAFRDDDVLQETVIVHAGKEIAPPAEVTITSSAGPDDDFILARQLPYSGIVHPDDPEQFIRVVPDGISQQVVDRMGQFQATLADLGLTVSTGRVVDFRAKKYLMAHLAEEAAPLIYPINLEDGGVVWPRHTRKMQYLGICEQTESQLVPNESYVLVKRFTSKEQNRRVISAVFEGGVLPGACIGFENHLNYYHRNGHGIDLTLAKGLSVYLNSTLVDAFFRQFNGHTQVNAGDLRSLKYPALDELVRLGHGVNGSYPTQDEIDQAIEEEFFSMATDTPSGDPIATKRRIVEALEILMALGLPRQQLNERSALTLLALLDLKPSEPWSGAGQPLRGITPIMDFMETAYGKRYAPNTRETVRRQTVHQFLDAGLIIANPDEPERAVNSPYTVYQIETSTLGLLRLFGAKMWEKNLRTYSSTVETLKKRYAQERGMNRMPVEVAPGHTITLSPGGQNVLVEQIIKEFATRFTPAGKLVYVGDTDEKFAYFDKAALAAMGVQMDSHGKMPDLIIHYTAKNWLFLIEAVTSHGPINPKRRLELLKLFEGSNAGLVLVTTFLSRKAMVEYLPEISWETEVWVAETPDHMIHFNGERFLGPY